MSFITPNGKVSEGSVKTRDGHWWYIGDPTCGMWRSFPMSWTNDEGDYSSLGDDTRSSDPPGHYSKVPLAPPLSKECRRRHLHKLTTLDEILHPYDFQRLVDAGARMLAQILERQVHNPTEHQESVDLWWNNRGETRSKWEHRQHPDDAKT